MSYQIYRVAVRYINVVAMGHGNLQNANPFVYSARHTRVCIARAKTESPLDPEGSALSNEGKWSSLCTKLSIGKLPLSNFVHFRL